MQKAQADIIKKLLVSNDKKDNQITELLGMLGRCLAIQETALIGPTESAAEHVPPDLATPEEEKKGQESLIEQAKALMGSYNDRSAGAP